MAGLPKKVMRNFRVWAQYHPNCTIREAFDHVSRMVLSHEDRQKMRSFERTNTSIRNFLTSICGYEPTETRRNGYLVYERPGAHLHDQKKADRYFGLLQQIWDDDAI